MELKNSFKLQEDRIVHFIVGDDIVLFLSTPPDTGDALDNPNSFIVGDDIVLLTPEEPGFLLKIEEINSQEKNVNVTTTNITPHSGGEVPDYIFSIDDSFVILNYHRLSIFGFLHDPSIDSDNLTKGIWEFDLNNIKSMVIPEESHLSGKKELWVYLTE